MTQITSDGGSSSYYEIDVPASKVQFVHKDGSTFPTPSTHIRVEVKDVIKYALDNDFDRGNVFKALVRLGKKDGATTLYDLNKCKFFIEEMIKDVESV
jgi:hypothetical protein